VKGNSSFPNKKENDMNLTSRIFAGLLIVATTLTTIGCNISISEPQVVEMSERDRLIFAMQTRGESLWEAGEYTASFNFLKYAGDLKLESPSPKPGTTERAVAITPAKTGW